MKPKLFTICLLCHFFAFIHAQRTYEVKKSGYTPEYGIWSEAIWLNIPVADSFTTFTPVFGKVPVNATSVQLCISGDGLIVKAVCYSAKVRRDGGNRDEPGTADQFTVSLDTWNDRQNAFSFTVSANGQQTDSRITGYAVDLQHDATWFGGARTTADGWEAVFVIPYTALRFPVNTEQIWGVQFTRFDRSTGETSCWAPQNPLVADQVWQYGQLTGLYEITQPRRMGVSLYNDFNSRTRKTGSTINDPIYFSQGNWGIGLDVRMGINPATTVDCSVIPGIAGQIKYTDDQDPIITRTASYPTLQNRPLLSEEAMVFSRTAGFDPLPLFKASWYRSVIPDSIEEVNGGSAISNIKLVTQTRKNIRLGMTNSVFSPFRLDYYPVTKGRELYNYLPVYNFLFAEKLFRNHSFIHLSMANGFIRDGLKYQQLSGAGQWHNKKNNLELSGNYSFFPSGRMPANESRRGGGTFSIARINTAWTGQLTFSAPLQVESNLFLPPALSEQVHIKKLTGQVSKKSYTNRFRRLQNSTLQLDYTRQWVSSLHPVPEPTQYASFLWSGLTRRFREFSFKTSISDLKDIEYFYGLPYSLEKEIKYPASITVALASDYRRKVRVKLSAAGDKFVNTNRSRTAISGTVECNPFPFLSVSNHLTGFIFANSNGPAYFIKGSYHFSRFNRLIYNDRLSADLFLHRRLMLSMGISVSPYALQFRQQQFLIGPGNVLEPSSEPLPFNPAAYSWSPYWNLRYNWGTSRFQLAWYRSTFTNYWYLAQEKIRFDAKEQVISLSYIINFNQDSQRSLNNITAY